MYFNCYNFILIYIYIYLFIRWKQSFNELNQSTELITTNSFENLSYPINYEEYYEPYIIISQKLFLPYDERFRGYGMNKCIQLKGLSMKGIKFNVIKQHYLIASKHDYSISYQQTNIFS